MIGVLPAIPEQMLPVRPTIETEIRRAVVQRTSGWRVNDAGVDLAVAAKISGVQHDSSVGLDFRFTQTNEFLGLCEQNSLNDAEKERLFQLVTQKMVDIRCKTDDGRKQNGLHLLCSKHEDGQLWHVARFLLARGVNAKLRDGRGRNALHLLCGNSASNRLLDLVKLLVDQYGVDVRDKVTVDGCNALHCLCCNENNPHRMVEVAKFLVRRGVDVCDKTLLGTNALHLLFQNNHTNQLLEMTRYLVRKGADPTAWDEKGYNAFHHLCTFNRSNQLVMVAKYLILQGVDPTVEAHGNNALYLFMRHNPHKRDGNGCPRDEMIRLLKSYGLYVEVELEEAERCRCYYM